MLYKTKAIILRAQPYGDTSLIISAYTELFGLQSYIVKGARKVSKKGGSQSMYFQPAALLDLVVYHNELKHLQLIKEIKWSYLYNEVLSNVTKYSVALFMVELLSKCIRQTETNEEMFAFAENALVILDQTPLTVTANMPLHFALQLAAQLGFRIEDNYSTNCAILDLQEGRFTPGYPEHQLYLDGKLSETTFELLRTDNPVTLYRLKLNQQMRRQLIQAYEQFFVYHISDFGYLKTVKVLEEVLG